MGLLRNAIANSLSDDPKSFSDVASDYMGNRIDQATQPFTDPAEYLSEKFSGNTDQSHQTPVTQTIKYKPDGTQEMVIKGSPQSLSSANPNTPTIVAPTPTIPVTTATGDTSLVDPHRAYQQTVQAQYQPNPDQISALAQPVAQPVAQRNPMQAPQTWSDITPGAPVKIPTNQPQPGPVPPQVIDQAPPGWQAPGTSSQTYNRMLQTNTGGQNVDAQGRPITTPNGGMYAAGITPEMANQPGFNVTPARDNSPAEYNRVGREVYGAMLGHWNNSEPHAVASYQAGPEVVQKAEEQARANGGSFRDYLPKETQEYLKKVLPDRPGAPIAFNNPEETEHIIHDVPAGTPANFFLRNQKDPVAMVAMAYDPSLPPGYRQAAAEQHTSLVTKNKEEVGAAKKANEIIANGGVGLQRELKKETEGGSYIKAYLFKRLGLTDLAKEEQQKLGAGDVWQQTMVGGKPAWVKYNGQGAPIKGYNEAGELDPNELIKTTGNLKNAEVGTQLYFDPASKTSDKYYLRRVNGTAQFVSATTGEVETRPEVTNKLVGMSVAGSLPQQIERAGGVKLAQLQAELSMIPPKERAKFISNFNAQNNTNFPIDLTPADVNVPGSNYTRPGAVAPSTTTQPGAVAPSNTGLATGGGRSAAEGNNPTGYGAVKNPDGSYSWDTYKTPQEGVAATQTAVGRYLNSEGIMTGVKPTPENVVGMWVNGRPETGPEVQNGSYVASVRRELQAAGVQLNRDGTIPNTPEANAAVTRAMIVHESGPKNAQKFLPYVGGQSAEGPAVPPAPSTQVTPANATPSAPTNVTPGQGPAVPTPSSPAEFTRQRESEKEQQTAFNKYNETDIIPKSTAGAEVANVRRQQINGPDGILNNPTIVGMMAGQGSAYDEVRNIIRDIATSKYDNIDLSQRVASLALSQREKDVLNTQISLRQQIAPLTLKANAGPGAISEAEHKINDRTIGDITRMPFYSTMTLISRDQFMKDQTQARAAFKEQHPEIKTTTQFNAAWSKEQERLNKMYDNVYEARAKYIKQYNPDGKNPGATVDAFKHYPVPEFSPTEGWVLKGYSKRAAMPSLDTFVR